MFVAGLRSIQCIIIRHVLACARNGVCKTIDVHTCFFFMSTCFNSIGKRNGLVHLFDVVPVHPNLCEHMKRSLAMVKRWVMCLSCLVVLVLLSLQDGGVECNLA